MFFTILIPTYNRKYIIHNAIQSLENQTFQDYEIIVVDDGSTDGTGEYISSLKNIKLKYIYKNNGGKHSALNLGIKYASGELLVILDSDDTLLPNALEEMADIWEKYREDSHICGVMGRSTENKKLIGSPFPSTPMIMSYLDYHFGPNSKDYRDCCECLRLSILKKYVWPEDNRTRFVPESFVTDQIGLEFDLVCVNNKWKEVSYLQDGITKNVNQHLRNNSIGYLYDVRSKLETIFHQYKVPIRTRVSYWWTYWNLVLLCSQDKDLRVSKVDILGALVRLFLPILNRMKGWK